jgi:hypothetical protein
MQINRICHRSSQYLDPVAASAAKSRRQGAQQWKARHFGNGWSSKVAGSIMGMSNGTRVTSW